MENKNLKNMIFVTIGSALQDFSRLIKRIDEIAPILQEEVVVQLGFTKYRPKNAKWFKFAPYNQAREYFKEAKIIIGHASAGPIMHAREFHKPLIIVPRNGSLNEHVDNHQMETANVVENSSETIEVVYDVKDLEKAIERAFQKIEQKLNYGPPASLEGLIACISDFVNRVSQNKGM